MATAGAAISAPIACRRPRRVRRRRCGGRARRATGGVTVAPVAPCVAPPAGSWLVMAVPPPCRGLLRLVDEGLRGLLPGGLRILDVPREDGLVDHLDPGTVVVVEDGVLHDAVRRLALGHHVAEDLVARVLGRVDLVDQVRADG